MDYEEMELEMNESERILAHILEYYPDMRYQKTRLDEMKDFLFMGYSALKNDAIEAGRDFDRLKINGILVYEKLKKDYTWSEEFKNELIELGKAHLVLKKSDKLDERFDLSPFELEKKPENRRLHCSLRRNEEEAFEDKLKLENEKKKWTGVTYEELVETYIRYKKKYELKKGKYDIDKNLLFESMKEEGIHKVQGFSIIDEATQYDFSQMYGVTLEEKVQIATNGEISIDLLTDKKINLLPDDLINPQMITKRYREPRLQKLREQLGENFYYVEGFREEDDILSRFTISTSKVEEAIDEGLIDPSVLKTERAIVGEDDLKLTFEIITEEMDRKRREVGYQIFLDKSVTRSLNSEEERRRRREIEKEIDNIYT